MTLIFGGFIQKQVARTEQEILNRIKAKEMHVTQLKRKLEGVKVRLLCDVLFFLYPKT